MNKLASIIACTVFVSSYLGSPVGHLIAQQDHVAIESLIEQLVDIGDGDVGYTPTMSGSSFLPLGISQTGSMLLGQRRPTSSNTLRKLVEFGPAAVPQLLEHLDDDRQTKIKLEHRGMMGGMFLSKEYDFNRMAVGSPPEGVNVGLFLNDESIETHTVNVGDLCFVALGQIVNRDFNAIRYQPTSIIIVNSPVRTKQLREAARREWSDLSRASHKESLISDFKNPDFERRRISAAIRIGYYYREELEALVVEQLAQPRYDVGTVTEFLRNQLYLVDEPETRHELFNEFVSEHGTTARDGMHWHLFSHLGDLERGGQVLYTNRSRECLVELFDHPADITSRDQPSLRPLTDTIQARFIDAIRIFPTPRIDDSVKSVLHSTDDDYLAEACARYLVGRGADEEIKLYIEARMEDADPNVRENLDRLQSRIGWTALHVAAEEGPNHLVAQLVADGADIDAQAANGQTPLHVASSRGMYGSIRALLELNADPDVEDNQGKTALHYGLRFRSAAEMLLNAGATPTDIFIASHAGRADLVREFLKDNPELVHARKDRRGETALHLAASQNRIDVVRLLLEYGANVTLVDNKDSKQTPLHLAAYRADAELIKLLLENGADPSAKNWGHKTPLACAREVRRDKLIIDLLKH